MDVKNKILVLGRSEINKAGLVSSVMAGTALEPCVASSEASAQIAWNIDTRYYTAQTEFWVDSTEPLSTAHTELVQNWLTSPSTRPSIPIDTSTHELHDSLSTLVDAIVFVFDPHDSTSFTDILPWAQFAIDHEPSILLCVAVSDTKVGGMDGQKDEWFDWCVQMGWEWVDLTDVDPESEYSVERVRDALVANEWATMVPKANSKTGPKTDHTPDSNVDIHADSNADHAPEPAIDAPPEQRDEWDMFDKIASTVDPRRVTELHQRLFTQTPQSDMSGLMSQLHSLRTEIAQLDPETARTRAAELALALGKHTL
ncbi:hypothetical protein IW139_002595 [Coemansia sp. RSA 353]|nr:hypothetical protein GGH17_004753 [Coemansia sp. RSA 788]KAJ2187780.1 hypothetical protein EV181_002571 [Coemansia sp. RSA 532]KAJ2205914.1 hypothetical protein IW145_002485 [Coemansia sp. RSA 521]KAJ2274063.1 hypothetical protein J3F81_002394 [Coemansia sp. RSA 371]KAJ2289302.1 hypothetical protein IW141_003913 [Coemansia sp. RSA 355]KAJ2297875.1 hypothetical protein IW139_002595 [Coemansia sp. RSA 353]